MPNPSLQKLYYDDEGNDLAMKEPPEAAAFHKTAGEDRIFPNMVFRNFTFTCNDELGFKNGSRLCHACGNEYKRLGTEKCARCPDAAQNWGFMVLGALVIFVVLALIVRTTISSAGSKEKNISETIQKITLNHLQVAALAQSFPLRWPSDLQWMFEMQGAISTLGDHLINPDCAVVSDSEAQMFYDKQLGFACVPLFTVVFGFLFWYLRGKISKEPFFRKRKTRSSTTPKDKFVVTICVVLYLLYPTLCQSAFRIFKCEKIGAKTFLEADLEEECFTGRHLVYAFSLGVGQILVFVIGMPLVLFIFLKRNKGNLEAHVTMVRYGLFYSAYNDSTYFWELMIVLRKIAVVAMSVFGAALGPLRQAQVILMVLVLCLIGEIAGRPYKVDTDRQKILGRLELGCLIVEWGTMWSGIMIFASVDDENISVALTITVAVVNVGMIAWLLYRLIRERVFENKDIKQKIERKIAAFLSKGPRIKRRKKLNKKRSLSLSAKPGHRSTKTAGDVELSKLTKRTTVGTGFVRSRKGEQARCSKCGQTLALENAPKIGGRIQRRAHRRQSSQISDLTETKRLYGQHTLQRSHTTGKLKKPDALGPALDAMDRKLDLAMSKKRMMSLNKKGLSRSHSLQNFKKRLMDFAGFSGTGVTSATTGKRSSAVRGSKYESDGDWDVELDDESGCYYRVNRNTGETEWVNDSGDGQADDEEDEGKWANSRNNPDIETRYDESSGYWYQVNKTNGDSRWLDDGDDFDAEDAGVLLFQADDNPLYLRSREEENRYIYDTSTGVRDGSMDTLTTKSGKKIARAATRLTDLEGKIFMNSLLTEN
jgi:hypothetical protein